MRKKSVSSIVLTFTAVWFITCFDRVAAEEKTKFSIHSEDSLRAFVQSASISGRDCEVAVVTKAGMPCLKVETASEFSDVFFRLNILESHGQADATTTSDPQATQINDSLAELFSGDAWFTIELWMPDESWTSAIKLNFEAGDGSLGGIPEVVNNFDGYTNRWVRYTTRLKPLLKRFQRWHGQTDVLAGLDRLSINPFTAHQAEPSTFFVGEWMISDKRPDDAIEGRLDEDLTHQPTLTKITFDDRNELRRQLAYRSFESSSQALKSGIAGNSTRAIRVKGEPHLNNIAFLPMFDRLLGKTLDFQNVERLEFRYFLKPGSNLFNGCTLYLVTAGWESILVDDDIPINLQPGLAKDGSWRTAKVRIADLRLEQVRGEHSVLPEVAELRLNLNYYPDRKNIELWLDDFEWKFASEGEGMNAP